MCLFSGPVRHVSATRIFTRPVRESHQLLVYAMTVDAPADVAMVLPIPVAEGTGEDGVRFVDMSTCQGFFGQVDELFPAEASRGYQGGFGGSFGGPPQSLLAVHDVGDFEASFVPTQRDFERLDPRFRLPEAVWSALPTYADWGFAVFKLRAGVGAGETPPGAGETGMFGRLGAWLGGRENAGMASAPPRPREYHPMAFEFPRRDPSRLFFPTTHVHDGAAHRTASFDHALYCQTGARTPAGIGDGWRPSSAPAGILAGNARDWLDIDAYVHKRQLVGEHPNADVFVAQNG